MFIINNTSNSDILPGVNAGASRTAGGIFAGLRRDLFSRGEPSRSRGRTSMSMAVPHSRYLIVVDYRGISGQSVIGGLVSKCRIHARRLRRDSLLVKR